MNEGSSEYDHVDPDPACGWEVGRKLIWVFKFSFHCFGLPQPVFVFSNVYIGGIMRKRFIYLEEADRLKPLEGLLLVQLVDSSILLDLTSQYPEDLPLEHPTGDHKCLTSWGGMEQRTIEISGTPSRVEEKLQERLNKPQGLRFKGGQLDDNVFREQNPRLLLY
ncbi:hypothetical protein Ancab_031380 [Ancistrocladus abbreviatus]